MRAVSFVDRLVFPLVGKMHEYGICLGDINNDDSQELIVGNTDGDLFIFKGESTAVWAKSSDLGTIATVLVGDILNSKSNYGVVLSAEGMCHILKVPASLEAGDKPIQPIFSQRLQANIVTALLVDVDADGNIELVLGLSDKVLRTYRWCYDEEGESSGMLIGLHKWDLAYHLRSVSSTVDSDGHPVLVVAQPGGTVVMLRCYNNPEEGQVPVTADYKTLALSRMRNQAISTQVLADFRSNLTQPNQMKPYVIATLDGTFQLVIDDAIQWSIQVGHQIAWLGKLDLTGDGQDEIITCAWDGQTYILDHAKKCVRFLFNEPVCTFTCGSYRIGSTDRPVLVYVTWKGTIHMFYNVEIGQMDCQTALDVLQNSPTVQKQLDDLNLVLTPELVQYVLYSPTIAKYKPSE